MKPSLCFILLVFASFTYAYDIYKDGAHDSNVISSKFATTESLYNFVNWDYESILDVQGKIHDIQYSGSNFMFILVDDVLFLHYFDFYGNSFPEGPIATTFFSPHKLLVDNEVSLISTFKDGVDFHYMYFKVNQKVCFGTLYENNWTDILNSHCISFSVPQHGWIKIDLYAPHNAYVLHEDKTLSFLNINGMDIELETVPGLVDVEMLSYPIIWRSTDNGVYHLEEQVVVDGDPSRSPIFITSSKTEKSFVVQYDSGNIIGYHFPVGNIGFTGNCPGSDTSCPSQADPTTVKGVSYSKVGLAYFPEEGVAEIISYYTYKRPFNHPGENSIYFISNEAYLSNIVLVADETKISFWNALFSKSAYYTLNDAKTSFDHVVSINGTHLKDTLLFKDATVTLFENGTTVEHTGNQQRTFAMPMQQCFHNYFTILSYMCVGMDNKVYINGELLSIPEISYSIQAIGQPTLMSTLYILGNNNLWKYTNTDPNYVLSSYFKDVDDVVFSTQNILLRKDNQFYCPSTNTMCCEALLSGDSLMEYDLSDNAIDSMNPIDKGEMEDRQVKQFVMGQKFIAFLTTDGKVYTCEGTTSKRSVSKNQYEHLNETTSESLSQDNSHSNAYSTRSTSVALLENNELLDNVSICKLFLAYEGATLYMTECNTNKVFYYKYRPNQHLKMNALGKLYENSEVRNKVTLFEDSPDLKKLVDVQGSLNGAYLIYEENPCDNSLCLIDEVISEGGDIVLPNSSTIIISGPSTINNSSVTIQHGTTIVIEDTLTIGNSTMVYHIPNQEILDSIQDGDSIVIIDTSGNGQIEGSFDDIVIDLDPSLENSCQKITAAVE